MSAAFTSSTHEPVHPVRLSGRVPHLISRCAGSSSRPHHRHRRPLRPPPRRTRPRQRELVVGDDPPTTKEVQALCLQLLSHVLVHEHAAGKVLQAASASRVSALFAICAHRSWQRMAKRRLLASGPAHAAGLKSGARPRVCRQRAHPSVEVVCHPLAQRPWNVERGV